MRTGVGVVLASLAAWGASAEAFGAGTVGAGKEKAAGGEKTLAAFLYVARADKGGWTGPHEAARLAVEKELSWVDTAYIEEVQEGFAGEVMEKLIGKGFKIIFSTHGGFKREVSAVARRHPQVMFASASSDTTEPNVAIYNAEFYQAFYLEGLMAGALTKSNKIGFVATERIPSTMRNVNAFAIGAREANPKAEVHVRFTGLWECEVKCQESVTELTGQGVDVFAHSDYTSMVVDRAAEKKIPVFSYYATMAERAPDWVVSGSLVHWDVIYRRFLEKSKRGEHKAGTLKGVHYWHHLADGTVELGLKPGVPVNPKFIPALKKVMLKGKTSVYDRVMQRLGEFKVRSKDNWQAPFVGPIRDAMGKERIPAGAGISFGDLMAMTWAAEGVVSGPQK